ncbi:MAG: hypothetical protein LBM69_05685 [Lachnospiraceae bacterium]|jgi:hypothetical protein|nr:hypothetical protein [Lachnospiraceae bacterium]
MIESSNGITGLQLSLPNIFVPFGIDVAQFCILMKQSHVHKVTNMYYTIKATLPTGLECHVGFHFSPQLQVFEFFMGKEFYKTKKTSVDAYHVMQKFLVTTYGNPTTVIESKDVNYDAGCAKCQWDLGNDVYIFNYVMERFGLENRCGLYLNVNK